MPKIGGGTQQRFNWSCRAGKNQKAIAKLKVNVHEVSGRYVDSILAMYYYEYPFSMSKLTWVGWDCEYEPCEDPLGDGVGHLPARPGVVIDTYDPYDDTIGGDGMID